MANAIDFLDAPSADSFLDEEPTQPKYKTPESQIYVKPLPGLSAETTAGIYTAAEAMSAPIRGIAQKIQEEFPSLSGVFPEAFKKETIEQQVKTRKALEKSQEYGTGATVGAVAGAVAEPLSIAVPLGKANTIKQLAVQAGLIGAGTGYISAKEEVDKRVDNAIWGGLAGTAGGLAFGAVSKTAGKLLGKDWFAGEKELTQEQLSALTQEIKKEHPKLSDKRIETAINEFTKLSPDAHLNARTKAQQLMDEGASLRKVEGIVKKNPLVGHYMDEILKSRAEMVRSRLDEVKQGEVLPPEVQPKGEFDAIQERSPTQEVSRDVVQRGDFSQDGQGVRQGIKGPEIAQEGVQKEVTPKRLGKGSFGQGGAFTPFASSKEPTNTGLPRELLEEGSTAGRDVLTQLDKLVGQVGTRISNINPALGKAALDVERRIIADTHAGITISDPFFTHINTKVGKESAKAFKQGWLNQNRTGIESTLTGEAKTSFQQMTQTLDKLGDELAARGIIAGKLEGYLPRMVKDREGLLNSLGTEAKSILEKKLEDTAAAKGRVLTPEEEANIINQFFRQGSIGMYKPGFSKGRTIKEVDESLAKFYHDPAETYHSYVQRATNNIHMADFFGKSKVIEEGSLNVEKSIGQFVQDLKAQGKLTPEKERELKDLLDARYKAGEAVASPSVQLYKNASTALALGNVVSAALNLTDPVIAGFRYGTKPALKAVLAGIKGEQKLSTKDYGLLDHISEEFVNTSPSQRLVTRVMKYSGWGLLDSFGKNTHFNSSLLRAQEWSKSEKGLQNLQKRYGEAFGEQFPQLVQDLRAGEATDLVKSMSFWDVAQHQPLTRLQRSEYQLKHPNITAFTHQFKSFMMAQANMVRVDAYNEIKKGNVKEGLTKLARLGAGFAVVGASAQQIQNFLLGRDDEISATDIANNAFKQIGYNEYAAKKFKEGKVAEGVGMYIKPSTQVFDVAGAMYGRTKAAVTGKDTTKERKKEEQTLRRAIPVVGRTLSETSAEGRRKYLEQQLRKKREEIQARRG